MEQDSGAGRAKNDSEKLYELQQRVAKIEILLCDPQPNPPPAVTARPRGKGAYGE